MKNRAVFIAVALLFLTRFSWSQPFTACFTVDVHNGCAPLTVTITSCSMSGPPALPSPRYNYDFVGKPTVITATNTFTYTTPGTYVIRQQVNNGGTPGTIVYAYDTIVVYGKPTPSFTTSLCANQIVQINITDTNYDSYVLDYGDGNIVSMGALAITNHSYLTLGNKTISVQGQYAGGCIGATNTKTVTPFTSLTTPDISDLTVTAQSATLGTVSLRYNSLANRHYTFESKTDNGAYSPIATILATSTSLTTQSFSNLNTLTKTNTFRIANTDVCGNTSAYSAEIPSIQFSAAASNGFNTLTFSSTSSALFSNYSMVKNGAAPQVITSAYIDNAVSCGVDYCYQLTGTLPTTTSAGAAHKSFSVSNCIKATYSGIAPTVTNINCTVEDNGVKINWDKPTLNSAVPSVSYYTVYRKNGASFSNYGTSNKNLYLDNAVSVNNQSYCYQVSYKDACNDVSAISNTTCSVVLTVVKTDSQNKLSWTPYTGYQATGIKEYVIENLDENGNVVVSKSAGLSTALTEVADPTLSQIIYRIKVVSNGTENTVSYSNTFRIDLTPQIFMPTVFTPNGDGENDVLEVKGKYFKSVRMTILNKWGEVVFFSDDYKKGWDGQFKGSPAGIDSYVYQVVAFDNSGNELSLKGVVSLLR